MLRQNYPQTLIAITEATGVTGSLVTTITPTDWNVAVGKLYATGFTGTSPTLDLYVQTQDPTTGTFFDVVHYAQITGTITEQNALFASFGKPQLYIGAPESSHISAGTVSGLPLLSRTVKVVYTYGGTFATNPTVYFTMGAVDQDYK